MTRLSYAATVRPEDGGLSLSGAIDQDDVAGLRDDLARHSGDHSRDLLVDLTGVVLLSSAAIHALLAAGTAARAHGAELHLVATAGCPAERVLRMCGIPHRTA